MYESEAARQVSGPLTSLPDDMADAFEQFKLTILRHRAEGWVEISEDHTLQVLYALMQIAMGK